MIGYNLIEFRLRLTNIYTIVTMQNLNSVILIHPIHKQFTDTLDVKHNVLNEQIVQTKRSCGVLAQK